MAIDEIIMSPERAHAFYERWVPAMRASQNSDTHPADETGALAIIEDMLPESPLITLQRYDISPERNRPNLFVTYTPSGVDTSKKGILFAGVHTDCVIVESDDQLVYRRDGDRVYGRGVVDNGSNVLACVELIRFLVERTPHFDRPITFAFTVDEEASSTHLGFEGLVKQGIIDTNQYAAAVFADTPWGAWSTKGVGLYNLNVRIDGSGHSGILPSAYSIAFELYGKLQQTLSEKFPDKGPFDTASIMQANVVYPQKTDGPTGTAPEVTIKGDLRTNPKYALSEIVETLNATASEFVENLRRNPQTAGYADKIHVEFKASVHEDGYVMPDEFMPIAEKIIRAGYEAAGIEGLKAIHTVGGGLPGLRGFVEQGLLTVATGAAGGPEMDVLMQYHAPNESGVISDICKGPAYLYGVAKQLDKELTLKGI